MQKLILWTQNQNQANTHLNSKSSNQNQEIKPKWTKLWKHLSGTYHQKGLSVLNEKVTKWHKLVGA